MSKVGMRLPSISPSQRFMYKTLVHSVNKKLKGTNVRESEKRKTKLKMIGR